MLHYYDILTRELGASINASSLCGVTVRYNYCCRAIKYVIFKPEKNSTCRAQREPKRDDDSRSTLQMSNTFTRANAPSSESKIQYVSFVLLSMETHTKKEPD